MLAPIACDGRRRAGKASRRARRYRSLAVGSAVAAGFVLVAGTVRRAAHGRCAGAGACGSLPAAVPAATAASTPALASAVVVAEAAPLDRRSSPISSLIRDAAARPLPGRAQAIRRHVGARRALGLPAQRHGRFGVALRRSAPVFAACRSFRRHSPGAALASWRLGVRAVVVAASPAAAERGARLAAAHPRRGQPTQLPGHLRGERRRQRRQRAHRPLLRRPEPVRAHRIARRPARKVYRHNDVVQTALAAEPRGDDRAARHAELVPGAAAGRRRRHRRVVRGARRRQRARRRPRGQRARWSARATATATAIASGPTANRACCCAPRCSASMATCSRLGVLRRRRSASGPARQRDCGHAQARRLSRRQAGR